MIGQHASAYLVKDEPDLALIRGAQLACGPGLLDRIGCSGGGGRPSGTALSSSAPPPRPLLRCSVRFSTGKNVLMVDDACASGGTFDAAHKFCMAAGARQAKGVALKTIPLWDPDRKNLKAKKLKLPCFTPWGACSALAPFQRSWLQVFRLAIHALLPTQVRFRRLKAHPNGRRSCQSLPTISTW